MPSATIDRFRALHAEGIFVMPNPWDIGSARYLAAMGFPALATTSSGHAATLGRLDYAVTREEMLANAETLAGAVDVPVSVDAERCFADDAAGVIETVRLIGETGAAGCSIEDYDPAADLIDPLDRAAERVAAAAAGARRAGLVLTARAENHLHGIDDIDDTIARLVAYRDAGAEVVYAPGPVRIDHIARVVEGVGVPVNVLARPAGPSVAELEAAGVRRVSTGGALSRAAFGALGRAARELLERGTSSYGAEVATDEDLEAAFVTGFGS